MDIELKNGEKVKIMITSKDGLYEYYMQGTKIGVYDPNKMRDDHILILQNTLENELSSQIKDEINAIDKEQIQQEAMQTKAIQDYAREELEVEKVRNIYTIELPQKDKKKDKENTKKKAPQKTQETKSAKVEEKTTTKDIALKQEIDLSERANDMHNLKKWLGGKIPPEFTKLAVIDSSDMSKMKDENGEKYQRNSTRYDLAVVDKDNNVEPLKKYIPELEQRTASGNNPMAQKYQVNKQGKVEKDAILSEYEIAGKIIQIDNKEMGRVEVNIGHEEYSGNETLGAQLRDSNSVYTTSKETRQVMGEYEGNGVRTVDENLKEVEQHEKKNPDCKEKLTYKDIDGDQNTKSHEHDKNETIDEMYIQYCVKEVLKNDEIANVYGKDDVRKVLIEKMKNKDYISREELIEETKEKMETNAQKERTYEDRRRP